MIALAWEQTGQVDRFEVYRGTGGPGSEDLTKPINGSTIITGHSYDDHDVQEGMTYHYLVVSIKGALKSIHSNELTISVPPPSPMNLTGKVA